MSKNLISGRLDGHIENIKEYKITPVISSISQATQYLKACSILDFGLEKEAKAYTQI
jgi:hypothetical protein